MSTTICVSHVPRTRSPCGGPVLSVSWDRLVTAAAGDPSRLADCLCHHQVVESRPHECAPKGSILLVLCSDRPRRSDPQRLRWASTGTNPPFTHSHFHHNHMPPMAGPPFYAGGAGCRNGIAPRRVTPTPGENPVDVRPSTASVAADAAAAYQQAQSRSVRLGGGIGTGAAVMASYFAGLPSRPSVLAAPSSPSPERTPCVAAAASAPAAASMGQATQDRSRAGSEQRAVAEGARHLGRDLAQVAEGAFASVRMETGADGRRIAVKTYAHVVDAPGTERQQMHELHLANEMRLVGRLVHPHVLAPNGARTLSAATALTMEYAPHGTLEAYVRRLAPSGGVPPAEVQRLFSHLLSALEYLHTRRLVHRDVKLENLVLDADWAARLIDYGAAQEVPPSGRLTLLQGTPAYMGECPRISAHQRPRMALGWPSDGPRMALGWPSDCHRIALGWPSDGPRITIGLPSDYHRRTMRWALGWLSDRPPSPSCAARATLMPSTRGTCLRMPPRRPPRRHPIRPLASGCMGGGCLPLLPPLGWGPSMDCPGCARALPAGHRR